MNSYDLEYILEVMVFFSRATELIVVPVGFFVRSKVFIFHKEKCQGFSKGFHEVKGFFSISWYTVRLLNYGLDAGACGVVVSEP